MMQFRLVPGPPTFDEVLHVVVSQQDVYLYAAVARAVDPIHLVFQPSEQLFGVGLVPVGAVVIAIIPEQHDPLRAEEPDGVVHDRQDQMLLLMHVPNNDGPHVFSFQGRVKQYNILIITSPY